MSKLSKVDKNFDFKTTINEDKIEFFNVRKKPIDLYGLSYDSNLGKFIRMPMDIAKTVNEGVELLCTNTSGGRIRFKTDSRYIVLRVAFNGVPLSQNMSVCGKSGFDMYVERNGKYRLEWVIIPDANAKESFESIHYFTDTQLRDITINFPTYNDINDVWVGIEEGSKLQSGERYINGKPIVYYGSSITQGGCASRPGNAYPALLSRKFNLDFINLGFSGSARGETQMAEYIKNLDMSCFVYDYDHNAYTANYLRNTHYPMYEIIRKKNPDLPIIMMTMPYSLFSFDGQAKERRDIIFESYQKALANGDKNVYFVDEGSSFERFGGEIGTVDLIHPNDLGFACMADSLEELIKEIYKLV